MTFAGDRSILGVLGNQGSGQVAKIGHDPSQQPGVRHRVAIIAEDPHSRLVHGVETGHLHTGATLGQGTRNHDFQAVDCAGLLNSGDSRRPIFHRRHRVGHRHYGRETACDRRPRPRLHILLPCLTGVAQMDVEIHEARAEPGPIGIDHPGSVRDRLGSDGGDRVALDHNGGLLHPVGPKHPGIADDDHPEPPRASEITAMRSGTPLATCSRMSDLSPSAAASSISTPRFIGPGCMTTAVGLSIERRSTFIP